MLLFTTRRTSRRWSIGTYHRRAAPEAPSSAAFGARKARSKAFVSEQSLPCQRSGCRARAGMPWLPQSPTARTEEPRCRTHLPPRPSRAADGARRSSRLRQRPPPPTGTAASPWGAAPAASARHPRDAQEVPAPCRGGERRRGVNRQLADRLLPRAPPAGAVQPAAPAGRARRATEGDDGHIAPAHPTATATSNTASAPHAHLSASSARLLSVPCSPQRRVRSAETRAERSTLRSPPCPAVPRGSGRAASAEA